MKKRHITLFTAIAAAAAFAPTAQAGTIYSDDFSGSAGDLSGTGPGWTATTTAGAWQLDGSGKATTGGGNRFAWLAFTPTSGNEYTLSMDVDVTSGGWMSIDFARDNSPGVSPGDGTVWTVDTYAWMLRKNAGAVQTFNGLATANGGPGATATGTFSTLKVVLNTVPALWTVEYFVDGISNGAPKAYGANPTDISWVGFGTEGAGGSVDNFLLTDGAAPGGTLFTIM